MTVSSLTVLVMIALIIMAVILIYVWLSRRRSLSSSRETAPQGHRAAVDHQLQSQLISLLAGDEAAAERLVQRAKLNYPGKTENWYWERVINELERDRR